MSDLTVRIGGLRFRGYADMDDYGYWISQGGWEGWETAPSARSEDTPRPNAHGTTDGPQWLDAREVVQSGFFRARTAAELGHMANELSWLLSTGQSETLTVDQNGQTTWAKARRGLTQPRIVTTSDGDLHVGEYELNYRMADPRRYGEVSIAPRTGVATSILVSHRGNFEAFPIIDVWTAPSNYTISSPAGTFTVTGATSGGTHRIDMRTGKVTRNGVPMPGVGRGTVWAVPPGAGWMHTLSAPGRVFITDTFI